MIQSCRVFGFVFACAILAGWAPAPAAAQGIGGFTLKPGETRDIHLEVSDHVIRLCNLAESAGTFDATIDDHDTHHLAPSDCFEDTGAELRVHNTSGVVVRGVYSRMYYLND